MSGKGIIVDEIRRIITDIEGDKFRIERIFTRHIWFQESCRRTVVGNADAGNFIIAIMAVNFKFDFGNLPTNAVASGSAKIEKKDNFAGILIQGDMVDISHLLSSGIIIDGRFIERFGELRKCRGNGVGYAGIDLR